MTLFDLTIVLVVLVFGPLLALVYTTLRIAQALETWAERERGA